MNPLIIDVEASGFGGASYPIEVGVALGDGHRYCSLILPAPAWTSWDEGAENLHGITRELLQAHGSPVDEVTRDLNELLDGMTLYSDGWVVDQSWLITLFHAAKRSMQFHVSPLEMILSEKQMAIWHATKDRVVKQANITRHRASHDAWMIQETYRQTLGQLGNSEITA